MDRMKTDYSNARPPQWAETLLRLLLTPKNRESVSGDLLEEYRDTIVPTLGPAAERWYVRQVGSFLLRASWAWGAIIGAALVVRYLFDTLVPPTDYKMRASVLTYTIMAACLLAGFSAAWRTRSITISYALGSSSNSRSSVAGAAIPKSISRTAPSSSTSTFRGVTSRCTIPARRCA